MERGKAYVELPGFGFAIARKITGRKNVINVKLSDPGELTFSNLMAVSDYFGTVEISWNSYYVEGCPTCGGENVTEFTISGITKHNPFGE